jgi:hypothetical protein
MDEETQLSGLLIRPGGTMECFFEGRSYGCVLTEELIDMELNSKKDGGTERWKES